MVLTGKRKIVALLLLFVASFVCAEQPDLGKMLIMGWEFAEEDPSLQTNMAIDAIINYAEAAKIQMSTEIGFDPSCKIELYRVYKDNFYEYENDFFEFPKVFIYVSSTIGKIYDTGSSMLYFEHDEYLDVNIQIDFYIVHNEVPKKYKLVLYYNNCKWLRNNERNNIYELVEINDAAYDFFISEIEKLRR